MTGVQTCALPIFKEQLEQMGKKLIITGMKEGTYEQFIKLNILDGYEKTINLGRIAQAISYAKQLAISQLNA